MLVCSYNILVYLIMSIWSLPKPTQYFLGYTNSSPFLILECARCIMFGGGNDDRLVTIYSILHSTAVWSLVMKIVRPRFRPNSSPVAHLIATCMRSLFYRQ